METKKKKMRRSSTIRPVVLTAVISLVVCGFLFPLVVTGVAQLAFPYQSNGELAKAGGHVVGSLVALNATDYTSPAFFHTRNNTASGFDPDITVADAYSQIQRISAASGVPQSSLQQLVNSDEQGTLLGLGPSYVNVQRINLDLVSQFPAQYPGYG
jgi:K+-transporting ATPase ATPase C chain